MKKKILIIAVGIMALVTALSLVGCGGKNTSKADEIVVQLFNGGYGVQWFNDIAREFEKEYPEYKVTLKKTVSATSAEQLVLAKKSPYDIVMVNYEFWAETYQGDTLADLTDVYKSKPDGENGLTIEEKLNDTLLQHFNYDNKYYQMTWASANGGICYNATSLNTIFGEGNWKLPTTTDELTMMCKDVYDHNHFGFVYSGGDGAYQDIYLLPALMSQYMGYETYYNSSRGYVDDGKGGLTVATQETIGQVVDNPGIERAYEVMEELSPYEHEYSYGLKFMDAQQVFCGWGYGSNSKLAAFMVNGDWLETEVVKFRNGQDIRMMKMPVISAIVEKLSFYNDGQTNFYRLTAQQRAKYDAVLKAIVSYVDGETDVKPTTVEGYSITDSDIAKVREARNTFDSLSFLHCLCVPITSKKQDIAKKFLTFLCSEKAQRIYCQDLNGLTMPYGYDYNEDAEFKGTVSTFQQSVKDSIDMENGYFVTQADYSSRLTFFGGLYFANSCCVQFANFGSKHKTNTAENIFNNIRSTYTNRWNNILRSAGYAE